VDRRRAISRNGPSGAFQNPLLAGVAVVFPWDDIGFFIRGLAQDRKSLAALSIHEATRAPEGPAFAREMRHFIGWNGGSGYFDTISGVRSKDSSMGL